MHNLEVSSNKWSGNEGRQKFTSRSAIEDYQKCPRLRWWRQFALGRGISPSKKSIPLSTGSCIHAGVEYLFRWAKEIKLEVGSSRETFNCSQLEYESAIENAVSASRKLYHDLVFDAGFTGVGVSGDINEKFTYNEQVALTEALIRAWAMKELPSILAEYEIVGTEKEITVNLPGTDIVFQARVDAELRHRIDRSYYNYSLKSVKMWNERSDKSYRKDLQGLTEIWAVENEREGLGRCEDTILNSLDWLKRRGYVQQTNIASIEKFLQSKLPLKGKVVDAVKFCFLIKGDRRESGKDYSYYDNGDGSGRYVTYSPLIRGYKRIGTMSIEYAHSYKFPNPNNKSGMGTLGKGWEPFNVWEDKGVGGVKGWMEKLSEKDGEGKYVIQPDCGDIIKNCVITPETYMRSGGEVESAITQIVSQEHQVFLGAGLIEVLPIDLDRYFPQHRHSCHWPSDCEMLAACWNPMTGDDPIGSGLYEIRTPHHEMERDSL